MTRSTGRLMRRCAMLLATSCAQSVHQTVRLARFDFSIDPGYAGSLPSFYWPGPGYGAGYRADYWGNQFGYYAIPTSLAGMDGMADMGAPAGRAGRQVCRGRVDRRRPMRRRNSKKRS